MASPQYKLFNPAGEYVACAKYLEDAAAFVAHLGDGATVRDGHSKAHTLWTEGREDFSAAESFDGAAEIMERRRVEANKAAYIKAHGAERAAAYFAKHGIA